MKPHRNTQKPLLAMDLLKLFREMRRFRKRLYFLRAEMSNTKRSADSSMVNHRVMILLLTG